MEDQIWYNPWNTPHQHFDTTEAERHYEAVAQAKAEEYYEAQQVQQVTRHDVDEAWRIAVAAADRHEDIGTMATKEAMLEATDHAERLQAIYDEQYEQWVTS